jgi:hypothetical protein
MHYMTFSPDLEDMGTEGLCMCELTRRTITSLGQMFELLSHLLLPGLK